MDTKINTVCRKLLSKISGSSQPTDSATTSIHNSAPIFDTPFLFIHTPKTAGTSFRIAARSFFTESNILQDYGPRSPETSEAVLTHVHQHNDLFELHEFIKKSSCQFFCGHISLSRYAPLFDATRMITFVRNPIDQLCSHYSHYVRIHGYTDTIDDFLSTFYRNAGLQARKISGIPIEAFGFIGITERYEESLYAFNATYGTSLSFETLNTNPERSTNPYSVSQDILEKYKKQLTMDRRLHARAGALLDARLHAIEHNHPYVHGALRGARPASISGFAFYSASSDPVSVELVINDTYIQSTQAVLNRPDLRAFNVPRNGYVGFDFKLSHPLSPGDRIVVCAAETGQIIGKKTIPNQQCTS